MEARHSLAKALTGRIIAQSIRIIRPIRGYRFPALSKSTACADRVYLWRGGAVMKTIETTITVLPDGSIHIPPRLDLPTGEHRAVLVVEEAAAAPAVSERDRATEALRVAGLLAEPSPAMQRLAAESTLTLDEARAILDRAGGKPLSEVILEMRGPKE